MHIGYFIPEFPSQTHAFFWRESRALEALGHRVSFYSTRAPSAGSTRHEFATEARARTRYVFPPPLRAFAYFLLRPWALFPVLGYVARLGESTFAQKLRVLAFAPCAAELLLAARKAGVEHIHAHSCADSAHIVALAERLGGPSYSATLHGDLEVYGKEHARKFERAALMTAVTTPLVRQLVEFAGVAESRVHRIPMGVDVGVFTKRAPRSAGAPLELLSVARLNPMKGHVFAFRALAALKAEGLRFSYRVIGGGDHRAALEAEVAALGLTSEVRFLGSLGEREVAREMASADVLLLTSFGLGEAAPVCVMEAMAAGVPPIVSIIGGTPEMIDDGVDGLLVPQEDVPAISAAIRRLADDLELWSQMSARAVDKAHRAFSHSMLAARFASAIAEAKR